ncbi:MAG TPA: hypothetical protein VFV50_11100 [Bdellovibrionales bacterium]|nr:hypothetical protein [Bdellovibrionales bacterium]
MRNILLGIIILASTALIKPAHAADSCAPSGSTQGEQAKCYAARVERFSHHAHQYARSFSDWNDSAQQQAVYALWNLSRFASAYKRRVEKNITTFETTKALFGDTVTRYHMAYGESQFLDGVTQMQVRNWLWQVRSDLSKLSKLYPKQ